MIFVLSLRFSSYESKCVCVVEPRGSAASASPNLAPLSRVGKYIIDMTLGLGTYFFFFFFFFNSIFRAISVEDYVTLPGPLCLELEVTDT